MNTNTETGKPKVLNKVLAVLLAPLLLLGTFVGSFALTTAANAMNGSASTIFANTNAYRASVGVQSLQPNGNLTAVAQAWAEQMAVMDPTASGAPQHNPNYEGQIPGGYLAAGENVGHGGSDFYSIAVNEWAGSPGHNSNMIHPRFTDLGVGYATSPEGRGFAVQVFAAYGDSPTYPGAPSTPVAVDNQNGTVTVSWQPPANTGNVPLNGYRVMKFDEVNGAQIFDTAETTMTFNVDRNRNYDFAVQAVNSVGVSGWSEDGSLFVPATEPMTPDVVVAPINVNDAVATFTVADDGGSPVTVWNVEFNGESYILNENTFSMTGLKRATQYTGSVVARNEIGVSGTKEFTFTTQATVPGAPTDTKLVQTGTTAEVTASWNAPADDGGSAITGYAINVSNGASSETLYTTDTSIAFPVVKGNDYTVSVTAANAIGSSDAASATLHVPYNKPSVVKHVQAKLTDEQQITVNWSAPADNGGIDPHVYNVEFINAKTDEVEFTLTSDGLGLVADEAAGVKSNTTYIVRVSAENVAGAGAQASSEEVVVPRTPTRPEPVASVSITATPDSITALWTEPESNGGSAITGYTVTLVKEGEDDKVLTLGPDVFNTTITGLDRASDYQVYVVAKNAKGSSDYILYNISTPATAPGKPQDMRVSYNEKNGETTLHWNAPADDGGKKITEYVVTVTSPEGSKNYKVTGDITELVLKDYGFNESHSAQIQAFNKDAAGETSNTVSYTTYRTSGAVQNLAVEKVTASSVQIKFEAPADSGSGSIKGYEVAVINKKGDVVETFTTENLQPTVSGLKRATEYSFKVTPKTAVLGEAATTEYVETLPTIPGTIRTLSLDVNDDNDITVNWVEPIDDGGREITEYRLSFGTMDMNAVTITVPADKLTHTFTGLDKLTTYTIGVTPVNSVGAGFPVSKSIRTGAEKPGAPENITFTHTEDPEQLETTVKWSEPADNGGAEVDGYRVTYKRTDGTGTPATVDAGTLQSVTLKLDRAIDYTFTVQAKNVKGYGAELTETVLTPTTYTSVPKLKATPGTSLNSASVTLEWEKPEFNGGCEVTEYEVQLTFGDDSNAIKVIKSADAKAHTFTEVIPNHNYKAVVTPKNCNPYSPLSTAIVPVKSNTILASPVSDVTLTKVSNTGVTASYTTNTEFGGDVLANVKAEVTIYNAKTGGVVGKNEASYTGTLSWSGLPRGVEYKLGIRVINSVGKSKEILSNTVELPYTKPTSVTDVNVKSIGSPDDAGFKVEWKKPLDDGGQNLNYVVTLKDVATGKEQTKETSSPSTSFTGLKAKTKYTVKIGAFNTVGATYTDEEEYTTSSTYPGKVENLTAKYFFVKGADNVSEITITSAWDAPKSDGGEEIVSYIATLTAPGEDAVTKDVDAADLKKGISFADLTPNKTYTVSVKAKNSLGSGSEISEDVKVPVMAPSNVRDMKITNSNKGKQLNISWNKPSSDGGDAAVTYQVVMVDRTTGEIIRSAVTSETSVTMEGYNHDAYYQVAFVTKNSGGESSNYMNITTPATVPNAVTNLAGADASSKTENSVKFNWDAATAYPSAPVQGYKVTLADADGNVVKTSTETAPTFTAGNLNPATVYTLSVTPFNSVGDGISSTASVTTGTVNPGVVDNLMVVTSILDGRGIANVTWEAPKFDGGAGIARYDLKVTNTVTGDVYNFSSVEPEFIVWDLDTVTVHTVEVTAVNAAGDKSEGTSTGFTTTSNAPAAVENVVPSVDETTASISWAPVTDDGANGKLGIKGYFVKVTKVNQLARTAPVEEFVTGTSYTISDLARGSEYDVEVVAVNNTVEARSLAAKSGFAVDAILPDAPKVNVGTVKHDQAEISWEPAYDGGAKVNSYIVSLYEGDNQEPVVTKVSGDVTSFTLKGLSVKTDYTVNVQAVNSVGESLPAHAQFTTSAKPIDLNPGGGIDGPGDGTVVPESPNAKPNEKKLDVEKLSETGSDMSGMLMAAGFLTLSAGGVVLAVRRKNGKHAVV